MCAWVHLHVACACVCAYFCVNHHTLQKRACAKRLVLFTVIDSCKLRSNPNTLAFTFVLFRFKQQPKMVEQPMFMYQEEQPMIMYEKVIPTFSTICFMACHASILGRRRWLGNAG